MGLRRKVWKEFGWRCGCGTAYESGSGMKEKESETDDLKIRNTITCSNRGKKDIMVKRRGRGKFSRLNRARER